MVLAPMEPKQLAVYDSYKDDAENSWKQKALEESVKKVPLAIPAAGLAKAGITTVGKAIPGITAAFAATDAVDGWNSTSDTFRDPGLAEKLAHAQAAVVNGLTLGLVPKQQLAKEIAQGYHGGKLTEIPVPTEEDLKQRHTLRELLDSKNN